MFCMEMPFFKQYFEMDVEDEEEQTHPQIPNVVHKHQSEEREVHAQTDGVSGESKDAVLCKLR